MNGFERQWNEYRKRRNLFLFAFLGGLPIVSGLGSLGSWVLHTLAPFPILAISWIAFFVVAGIRLSCWPCPRCGDWFAATWWSHNLFAQRCVHCGLPKYSNGKQPGAL